MMCSFPFKGLHVPMCEVKCSAVLPDSLPDATNHLKSWPEMNPGFLGKSPSP